MNHVITLLATAAPNTAPTTPANPASPPGGMAGQGLMLAILAAFFVFMLLTSRSQRNREKKERDDLMSKLSKNDRVLTLGGIIGTVVSVKDNEVVLKVDENTNTKMTFLKSAIQRILVDDPGTDKG